MTTFESTIEVERPLSSVYNAWTQFETFPRFMEHVERVDQLDDTHLHWKASIAGREHEWDAEITEQRPDEIIAWQATTGVRNGGSVSFEPAGPECTRIKLQLDYEPEGVIEKAGAAVGAFDFNLERDLKSFKQLVEEGEDSGAGWRGEVLGGQRIDQDPDGTPLL